MFMLNYGSQCTCASLLPSKDVLMFIIFNVTYYLESSKAITSHDRFPLLPTNMKWVVWTLYNLDDCTCWKVMFLAKKL